MTDSELLLEASLEEPIVRELAHGSVAAFTSPKPDRDTPNEDAAAIIPYIDGSCLLVVADGAGGARDAARASRIAVESLAETVQAGMEDERTIRAAVLDGVEKANARILELGSGAASTIAVVRIDGRSIRPFHVGDSLIMVTGQRGKLKHVNLAHGPVGYGVEAGLISEREAMQHESRHLLSNAVGSQDMRIEVGPTLTLAARDTVVIASDGLSDNLFTNEIVERVRKGPIDKAVMNLARTGQHRMKGQSENQPSKPDDLTIVVYRPKP